jgi:hypothetical protein
MSADIRSANGSRGATRRGVRAKHLENVCFKRAVAPLLYAGRLLIAFFAPARHDVSRRMQVAILEGYAAA